MSEFGISSFYGCNSLTSITFGPQLNSIGSTCFCGCRNLESVTFLNSSHEIIIDSQAFASLEKLDALYANAWFNVKNINANNTNTTFFTTQTPNQSYFLFFGY